MKSLLLRFRRWMILKLGGYLDPGPVIQAISRKDVPIKKIVAETRIMPTRDPGVEQFCKDEALRQLIKSVDQSGFILWHIQHTHNLEVIIRATMLLVDANNLDTWNYEIY